MNLWRLKKTVPHYDSAHDEALREFGDHDDLPPVHVNEPKFNRALAGLAENRMQVPNGLSVEDICRFMDHAAQGK